METLNIRLSEKVFKKVKRYWRNKEIQDKMCFIKIKDTKTGEVKYIFKIV